MGFAFVSCSKTDVFEENQANFVADQMNEYRVNFEAKYGKVDPNQSWDFTDFSASGAGTRAGETMTMVSIDDPTYFQQHVHNDKDGVKSGISGAGAQDWNPYVSVNMYPVFSYDPNRPQSDYFCLAVNYNGGQQIIFKSKINKKSWWNNNGADLPSQKGKGINTTTLEGANNVSWSILHVDNKNVVKKEVTISSFKEVIVNSRTYWCFDLDGNTDYYEYIFFVTDRPNPVAKRYFVEDLGSKDDFDFNDIVFDIYQGDDNKQKCIIRAMGGTLDFTLNIAGKPVWTKSVEGVAKGYVVKTMYNTNPTPKWDDNLAEFEVTGWNPSANNVSVSVKSNVSDDVIIEVPFPKTGEVPMILAVKTFVDWQLERDPLPEDFWYIPEDEE
jgi:hypothetical protein